MAGDNFTFQLEEMPADQLVGFALELVAAAAWLRYQAQVDVEKVVGIELDREGRRECVQAAFEEALERLSAESPFREVIRRYLVEVALPLVEEGDPPPTPKLRLVR